MATNFDSGKLKLQWGKAKRQLDLQNLVPTPTPKAQELVSGTSGREGKCQAITDLAQKLFKKQLHLQTPPPLCTLGD